MKKINGIQILGFCIWMQIKIHLVNKIWQCGKDRYGSHGEDVEGGASADLVGHSGPAETAHKIT